MISPKKSTILLVFLLITITNTLLAQTKASPQGHILSASDIHFDPYYDPSLVEALVKANYKHWPAIFATSKTTVPNGYGSDSNYPLFISALAAMKKQNASPAFIIITGDFLAHSFQANFAKYAPAYPDSLKSFTSKTIQLMAMMFDQYFPKTTVLPVLGNNDSFCGDYMVEPDGAFLAMFARAWVPLQRNHKALADKAFVAQFTKGGYYTFALRDGSGGKMVMLNTIFLSRKYTNCGIATFNPAAIQLNWLAGVLKQSRLKKDKVWLAAHIPPGIDVNSTINSKAACPQNIVTMLNDSCNRVYLQLLAKYNQTINANFAGHTHMDDFRVLYSNSKPVSFIHITPAVSPLFANNPGFECLTYSKATFGLLNMQAYYLTLNKRTDTWQFEYDFKKVYGVTGITPQSMDQVRKKIATDTTYRNKYIGFYNGSDAAFNSMTTKNWKAFWCGTGNLTRENFAACYCAKWLNSLGVGL